MPTRRTARDRHHPPAQAPKRQLLQSQAADGKREAQRQKVEKVKGDARKDSAKPDDK